MSGIGNGERDAEVRGQISSHAGHRHRVGPVGVDLEVVEDVGLDPERVAQGRSGLVAVTEDENSHGIAWKAELRRRTQHAVGPFAAQLAAADLHAVAHRGPERGERHEVALAHVERAAADLERLAVTGVHVDELDAIGVGMRAQPEHSRDDDAVEALADAGHLLDRRAERAESVPPMPSGIGVDAARTRAARTRRTFHQNCSRNRMSLENRSRRSSTPCLSLAKRSMPKPNAKPCHSSGSSPQAVSTFG